MHHGHLQIRGHIPVVMAIDSYSAESLDQVASQRYQTQLAFHSYWNVQGRQYACK